MSQNTIYMSWVPVFQDKDEWNAVFEQEESTALQLGTAVQPVVGGATNYEKLSNHPSINGVTLLGDKTNEDLHIGSLSNMDIERILNSFV